MKILVVNDDGIGAQGLETLATELAKVAEVTVVAPARQHSGASSSITVNTILKITETYKNNKFFGYSVDGTPADCVKLALQEIFDTKPDYIFSGINPGANLSMDVNYSGTVAAANEGLKAGITSCAVSVSTHGAGKLDYTPSAIIARKWLEIMVQNPMDMPILYNINVPPLPIEQIKGIAPSHLTNFSYNMTYEKRVSPSGAAYYWLGETGLDQATADDPGSDVYYLKNNFASVTPLTYPDRTFYGFLKNMKESGILDI